MSLKPCGLGKRYRQHWALRDCTLAIPAGRIVALVGPNGAGKTTLLHLVVGLATPTIGSVTVLGSAAAGSLPVLEQIAFVAQDAPLYGSLSVASMLELAASLNRRFDRHCAELRLADLGIPLRHRVRKRPVSAWLGDGGRHAGRACSGLSTGAVSIRAAPRLAAVNLTLSGVTDTVPGHEDHHLGGVEGHGRSPGTDGDVGQERVERVPQPGPVQKVAHPLALIAEQVRHQGHTVLELVAGLSSHSWPSMAFTTRSAPCRTPFRWSCSSIGRWGPRTVDHGNETMVSGPVGLVAAYRHVKW